MFLYGYALPDSSSGAILWAELSKEASAPCSVTLDTLDGLHKDPDNVVIVIVLVVRYGLKARGHGSSLLLSPVQKGKTLSCGRVQVHIWFKTRISYLLWLYSIG